MTDTGWSGAYETDMVNQMIETLLCTTPNAHTDETLDENYDADDLAPGDRDKLREIARGFLGIVEQEIDGDVFGEITADDMGHNFILSANGHGTGFWDRGWGDRGDALHTWAKTFREIYAYVADDGKVHVE